MTLQQQIEQGAGDDPGEEYGDRYSIGPIVDHAEEDRGAQPRDERSARLSERQIEQSPPLGVRWAPTLPHPAGRSLDENDVERYPK
ncbi:MAG: hypothetical protein V9F03_00925 [Microthrixaceae bacterium]